METETINIQSNYEEQLNNLWCQTINNNNCSISPYKEINRGYVIERELTKNSILFLSMNPSLLKDEKNNDDCKGRIFYDIPQRINSKEKIHPFWRALNEFYEDLKDPKPQFSHHDLLFLRETNQKSVLSWKKDNKLQNFFNGQLEISIKIIINSKPKLIVVLNAGARVLFEDMFDKINYNEDLGVYMYNIGGKKTPVLFSGMLSGQRALDKGSRELLKWHINYVLKQISV